VATGHVAESEAYLQFMDQVYLQAGYIPDWADMVPGPCPNGVACWGPAAWGYTAPENGAAEITALYLLTARDYYVSLSSRGQQAQALAFLASINASLQYAMDVQLEYAAEPGENWRMRFEGDETETGGDGIGVAAPIAETDFSLASTAMAAASLDFYIQYVRASSGDPDHYTNSLTGQTGSLQAALVNFEDAIDTFWLTDPTWGTLHNWWQYSGDQTEPLTSYTLFPEYLHTPLNNSHTGDDGRADVLAMRQFYLTDSVTGYGYLPKQPVASGGFLDDYDGHGLGYFLYDLVRIGDPLKDAVYNDLVRGPSVGAWGTYWDVYWPYGRRVAENRGLRPFESGVNVTAIAAYWSLGT
jgi:hypothetical protein